MHSAVMRCRFGVGGCVGVEKAWATVLFSYAISVCVGGLVQ